MSEHLLLDASMGSDPGNGAPPKVWPLASSEVSDLPQNNRPNTVAMGSITGLHVNHQETVSEEEKAAAAASLLKINRLP